MYVRTLLSMLSCLCLACATRHDAGVPPCPVIEMSAVADTQTDSTKTIALTGDITGAIASQAEDRWGVDFTVTDAAAKRVHEFTEQYVGRNLALVVDGRVHG